MNLKKWGIGLLFVTMFSLGLILTFSNISIFGNKYEVINDNTNISSGEANSVINEIDRESYQDINGANIEAKKTAYIVIDEKKISSLDSAKLIALSRELGIKLTFVDNKDLNKQLVESEGHTVIPDSKDLEKFIDNENIKTVKLSDGVRVKLLENKGIIIFIDNIKDIDTNEAKIKNEVKNLKAEGYTFKALM